MCARSHKYARVCAQVLFVLVTPPPHACLICSQRKSSARVQAVAQSGAMKAIMRVLKPKKKVDPVKAAKKLEKAAEDLKRTAVTHTLSGADADRAGVLGSFLCVLRLSSSHTRARVCGRHGHLACMLSK